MNKTLLYFAFSALLISFTIFASVTTFEVTVNIVSEEDNLKITQQKPIKFPLIRVNDSVKIGDSCFTNDDNHSQLCKDSDADKGNRDSGTFSVISALNTHYNIALSSADVTNGMRFTASLHPTIATLTGANTADNKGKSTVTLYGMLELINPEEVTSGHIIFNYDVTLTYN